MGIGLAVCCGLLVILTCQGWIGLTEWVLMGAIVAVIFLASKG